MTQENKDIQPQTEPYIVKSHDIHIDADYADWIADIKSRYRSAQVKAAVKVNAEKLLFNWQLGCDLVQKKAEERWGAGVVEQVSLDLKREFPNAPGWCRIEFRKTPPGWWRISIAFCFGALAASC